MFCPECGKEFFALGRSTPAEFWVRAEAVDHARTLLQGLTSDPPRDADSNG